MIVLTVSLFVYNLRNAMECLTLVLFEVIDLLCYLAAVKLCTAYH
jgi:hypothetical protein